MVCFLKKGNTIDLTSVGIHKSCYSELQGGGVVFKCEKADISWKNYKELTEEGATMGFADKCDEGELSGNIISWGFCCCCFIECCFSRQSTGTQCPASAHHAKELIQSRTSTKKVYWDEEEKLIREIEVFHLFTWTQQRLWENITVVYKYTRREKSYLKDNVDMRANGHKMVMNKLKQEIRRKQWNETLEQPSNRNMGGET